MKSATWGRVALGLTTLLASCAPALPPPPADPIQQLPLGIEYPSSSAPSSSSMSLSESRFGKGLTVPHRQRVTDTARLSVRPDVLRIDFAVRQLGATPDAALQAARVTVASVTAELVRSTRPSAVSKIRSFTLARNTRNGKQVDVSASVDGVLEVPLAPSEDFWARGQLYAAIIEAAQRLVAAHDSTDGLRAVRFGTPEAQVLDPEQYRPELLKRWVERARQFAEAAQAEKAPLFVRDCAPPGPVAQTAESFDEVNLDLNISCRIDTRGKLGE